MREKSDTKVIEISSKLVIENHKIFEIPHDAIGNISACIGKARIHLSARILVM